MSQIYLNPKSIKDGSITIEKLDAAIVKALGVPIVDSIDSLDSNAEQGSLAVLAANSIEEVSLSTLYQFTEEEISGDMETILATIANKGSNIDNLNITPPTVSVVGEDQSFVFNLFSLGDTPSLYIVEIFGGGCRFGDVNTEQEAYLWKYDGTEITVYEDGIAQLQDLVTSGNWKYVNGGCPADYSEGIEYYYSIIDQCFSTTISSQETTLYIKGAEGWDKFNLDVVNDFNGGIDKALSAEMGKVLNEKISEFITGNTTEPIKFKGYVNVETTTDIDNIYDNMQIGEACLVAPSVKGDADSDSYVPWIYTATQNDYLPLGDGLLKSNISKVLNGEIRTYFTLDKENPYWKCPDMLLLAKVKVKIKQFVGIIDMSSTLKNILNLLPDSTEITACIGKVLRWSVGDEMPKFAEALSQEFTGIVEGIGYKTKYPWGTKFVNMLTNGVCAYTPDTITCYEGDITANWTGFVTCSTDPDGGGYYHFIQTAICRDNPRNGNMWMRMGYYKGSADSPEDLQFFSWQSIGGIQNATNETLKEITYSDLVQKRDNSELIPGATYRINDYQCTTTEGNTKSANNQFDIIVTATSTNTLSHLAKAALHEGDTYFASCNLEAWQLWYDIDNSIDKYAWADSTNGKGVIYRMIDDRNNDCPYDFKNILFYTDKYTSDITSDNYYYTFSYVVDNVLYDGTVESQVKECYGNSMKGYSEGDNKFYLNRNVFRNMYFENGCSGNTFGDCCISNTFGDCCISNTFGDYCISNTFGDYCCANKFKNGCSGNTFGNDCYTITFGDGCESNTFGDNCESNTFGDYCCANTFGNRCYTNTFGYSCNSNKFGYSCNSNTFGDNCTYNTFGDNCYLNTFGNICISNTFGNDYKSIELGNECQYINLNSYIATTPNNNLQNIRITNGLQGRSGYELTITADPGSSRNLVVTKDAKGNIIQYFEGAESIDHYVKITYSDLKTLRDNSQLVPGCQYRITDYQCITVEKDTKSANNQFDIIVTADDESTLSHLAKATLHEGDTYFASCDLEAWQLWYDIDNDNNKYVWTDSTNGKGVIYRMIDDRNNDCPYDFKNILFYTDEYTSDTTPDNYYYTFSYVVDGVLYDGTVESQVKECYSNSMDGYSEIGKFYLNRNIFRNASFANICYVNTFGDNCYLNKFGNDCYYNTFGNRCGSNKFGNYCNSNKFGYSCNSNKFGYSCNSNTFGDNCTYNTFGNNCTYNTFGNGYSSNTLGNYCDSNKFESSCNYNIFGDNCNSNTLGSTCLSNTLGNNCSSNTLGNICYANTFGDSCDHNIFGNNCESNTFGNYCDSNTFRNRCNCNTFGIYCHSNTFGDYYKNIKLGNECSYINLTGTSGSEYLQNVKVTSLVFGTKDIPLDLTIERNREYETIVAKDSKGELKIYCEVDTINILSTDEINNILNQTLYS